MVFRNLSARLSPRSSGGAFSSLWRRYLSGAETTSALRPFYFEVHPDLFARHPHIALVNEKSLKLLHEHLSAANRERGVKLTFYLRNKLDAPVGDKFQKVNVNLHRSEDALETVRNVLEGCHLSTDHLPKVTKQKLHATIGFVPHDWTSYDDEQIANFVRRKTKPPPSRPKLGDQMRALREEAERRRATAASVAAEVERTVEELRTVTGLASVECSAHWSLTHSRGALASLRRLLLGPAPPLSAPQLRGHRLRFGARGTFCAADGTLVLGLDDVPEQWLRLLQFWTTKGLMNEFQMDLGAEMGRLSAHLQGASISWPDDTRALSFLSNARALSDRVSGAHRFCHGLHLGPAVRIVVRDATGALLLDAAGAVHVPSNVRVPDLEQFLRDSVPSAKSQALHARKAAETLAMAAEEARTRLGLAELRWDPQLSGEELVVCLERLGGDLAKEEAEGLSGFRLRITRPSESPLLRVADDGVLCLPVDWHL